MPQMSPMNWVLLYLYFSLIFYLTCTKLYFMKSDLHFLNKKFGSSQKTFNFSI